MPYHSIGKKWMCCVIAYKCSEPRELVLQAWKKIIMFFQKSSFRDRKKCLLYTVLSGEKSIILGEKTKEKLKIGKNFQGAIISVHLPPNPE